MVGHSPGSTGVLLPVVTAATLALFSPAVGDEEKPEKLRILVDKTFMHLNEDKPLTEAQVGEIAAAGFNVVVPRRGASDLDFLERCATWADDHGIAFMPWMRGTLASDGGPEMVWADGRVTPICSPTSDRLWDWLTRRITAYARLSTRVDSVMGVFLDYEIYAQPKGGNAYSLSYDRRTLQRFAEAKGIDPPSLEPAARRRWLKEQGLHEAFATFQVSRWRKRCRRLRKKVDRINPAFRFCVYPADNPTPFIKQAIHREWATERAPLILAGHSGYGRRGAVPHDLALEANRRVLRRHMRAAAARDFPHAYIGGIDPKVEGADPEFSGKNALMQTQVADGYWVFYEGPTQPAWQDRVPYFTPGPEDHEAYMKWFAWANDRIEAGDLDAWKEPRQTVDRVARPASSPSLRALDADGASWTDAALEKPGTRLRGSGAYYIRGRDGEPVRLRMRGHRLGDYRDVPAYAVHGPDGTTVKKGRLKLGETVRAAFTPKKDGIYQLITHSRRNAASVRVDAAHWVMAPPGYPDRPRAISICQFARRLYFHVPTGTSGFTVVARAPEGSGERAAAKVLDPEGRKVAAGESKRTVRLEISVPTPHRGAAWSVVLQDPKKGGIFEDVDLRLEGVPPLLAEAPEALLVPGGR